MFAAMTATAAAAVEETAAIAEEVAGDLEKLKPSAILETLKGGLPGLMTFGYRLVMAGLIVLIGMRIIKICCRFLDRSFTRMDMEISLKHFLIAIVKAGAYIILIIIAADKLGFNTTSLLAVVGSAGVAVALSLQESLSNFAGGVLILVGKPFKVGDYVVTTTSEGTVSDIGLVYTTLLTADNKSIVIPNGTLANGTLTNVTAMDKRRLDIKVGISYEADIKVAKRIIEEIFEDNPLIMQEEPSKVYVADLADSSVDLSAWCWVGTGDYWTVRWDILETIKHQFDAAGIEIPFNQMDVHVK